MLPTQVWKIQPEVALPPETRLGPLVDRLLLPAKSSKRTSSSDIYLLLVCFRDKKKRVNNP